MLIHLNAAISLFLPLFNFRSPVMIYKFHTAGLESCDHHWLARPTAVHPGRCFCKNAFLLENHTVRPWEIRLTISTTRLRQHWKRHRCSDAVLAGRCPAERLCTKYMGIYQFFAFAFGHVSSRLFWSLVSTYELQILLVSSNKNPERKRYCRIVIFLLKMQWHLFKAENIVC